MAFSLSSGGEVDVTKRYGLRPQEASTDVDAFDNGPALNDAINDDTAGSGFLSPGTYRVVTPARYAGDRGPYRRLRGVGSGTMIRPDMEIYQDCLTYNGAVSAEWTIEDIAFVGPVDPESVETQCNRALAIGGSDFASYMMRRVVFAGIRSQSAVFSGGYGTSMLALDQCSWIACRAQPATATNYSALCDIDWCFGAKVIGCRFLGNHRFNGVDLLTDGPPQTALKFRGTGLALGIFTGSQIDIRDCIFQGCASGYAISCFDPVSAPNGPLMNVYMTDWVDTFGMTPTGVGVITVSGTPAGGYNDNGSYTILIRIDTSGAAGVATWSTSFENAGFGGGFTSWVSHDNASSAAVADTGVTVNLGAGEFSSGKQYQTYVMAAVQQRYKQAKISNVQIISAGAPDILLGQIDQLEIDHVDIMGGSIAMRLYDCGAARIIHPRVGGATISAHESAFGFGSNKYVYVEDPNADAVLALDSDAWKTSILGVEETGP
jgi:hypothetical protein